jgi:alpha-D-xyloside xylohydrolase
VRCRGVFANGDWNENALVKDACRKVRFTGRSNVNKMGSMQTRSIFLSLFLSLGCFSVSAAAVTTVSSVHQDSNGVTLRLNSGTLRLEVYSPRIIRVTYGLKNPLPLDHSLAVIGKPGRTRWKLAESADEISLRTDDIEARVNRTTGAVGFYDKTGKPVLEEEADGRSLTPDHVGQINSLNSRQAFVLAPGEAVYGLGQHQQGVMNYRGTTVHLQQENREVAVPVLVSSRGYGVLWDNPAITDVDAGKSNPDTLVWSSEAGDTIDYYFMFGPDLDQVIADYRDLTGTAPLFAKWAWGFWQCKEHYASQDELLQVAGWYREHHVPLDGVIQDWQYWAPNPWGSHRFDTNRYPDVAQMMRTLHGEHVHMLISVWARFDVGCSNALELERVGGLFSEKLPNVYPKGEGQWYDPFNAASRNMYWQQISRNLFSLGIDGWWLDASEPELSGHWGEFRDYSTAAGPGAKVFNAYPLLHTAGVYQGQRTETPAKRVFILTRSAYAGQQRNAAVTWSGDIQGNWNVFARQIPAGLNFAVSGIPYWNTDIGGFFGGDPKDPKYAELFTRWFQFGAFCPMFRVHGTNHPKEMWRFDTNTESVLIDYDQLRYHLLPYVYSVSWMVTGKGYTMMRPLVMDFRQDTNVYEIKDQYMFGPSLMVCPVTQSRATSRPVYLPAGTGWVDFWTGKSYAGSQTVTAAAPIQTLPLFVRAGSIIPYGPAIEYAMETNNPIELRVYRGADGSFTLYEDEGDNYNYEKGKYATIPISWTEADRKLTIGKRQGKFPGMLKERTFHIVWVSPDHGTGIPSVESADAVVHYNGNTLQVSAP